MLAKTRLLPAERCLGRVLADFAVSCPPAVPIAVCGERLDEDALRAFRYYGAAALPGGRLRLALKGFFVFTMHSDHFIRIWVAGMQKKAYKSI